MATQGLGGDTCLLWEHVPETAGALAGGRLYPVPGAGGEPELRPMGIGQEQGNPGDPREAGAAMGKVAGGGRDRPRGEGVSPPPKGPGRVTSWSASLRGTAELLTSAAREHTSAPGAAATPLRLAPAGPALPSSVPPSKRATTSLTEGLTGAFCPRTGRILQTLKNFSTRDGFRVSICSAVDCSNARMAASAASFSAAMLCKLSLREYERAAALKPVNLHPW
nr:uncharacterized protein LOC121469599 [Taeniopygia guttata]